MEKEVIYQELRDLCDVIKEKWDVAFEDGRSKGKEHDFTDSAFELGKCSAYTEVSNLIIDLLAKIRKGK